MATRSKQKVSVAGRTGRPVTAVAVGVAERKYRAPALEKGLDVLELLAATGQPMSLMQISNQLGRSVNELFRMVQVLEFRGYVHAAPAGEGYLLTDRLFALGMTRAPTKDLVETALPFLRQFTQKTHQSCHLAVASGDQMVVVARIEAPGDLGFSVRVGFRRSLVLSTSGLVLFAYQPETVRAEWHARLGDAAGKKVWKDFEARARRARRDGFVRMPSDITKGIVDLSAPVMQHGGVVGAMTCPHVETRNSLSVDATIRHLRAAAQEVSTSLAGGLE